MHDARLATAALGAVAVGVLGLVAAEAFGLATALVAMLIAALYPPLIALSGTPYSENLLIPLELAAVWAGLRARRARNPIPLLAAAGVFTGLATLTHQNGIVIILPLIVCALACARTSGARHIRGRRRSSVLRTLTGPLVLVACAALTIAPWTIRNAIVLHRFIPVTDETGITLAGEYNPSSAANAQIPYRWKYYGKIPADASIAHASLHLSEPALSSRLVTAALNYIGRHPSAPALAAYHNLRRLLELEGSAAWRISGAAIGLSRGDHPHLCVCVLVGGAAGARGPLHAPSAAGAGVAMGRSGTARAERDRGQRRDASLPRPHRPLRDHARGVRRARGRRAAGAALHWYPRPELVPSAGASAVSAQPPRQSVGTSAVRGWRGARVRESK